MRLFLQQRPAASEAPKFVQLVLEQDLLGGWSVIRESGTVGQRSTLKREQFLEQPAALAAFERARDTHLRKGYQVMFTQGPGAPR